MTCLVVSHKLCWTNPGSPGTVFTDGGFPLQMRSLAELFSSLKVAVPVVQRGVVAGQMPLEARTLTVLPLTQPLGRGNWRKLAFPFWFARSLPVLTREVRRAGVVHVPLPGDVGTAGLALALGFRKRLFTRHCGDWNRPRSIAEMLCKKLLERTAGNFNVTLATGGGPIPPSARFPHVKWIFSSSLTEEEIREYGRVRTLHAGGPTRLIILCRQVTGKGSDVLIRSLKRVAAAVPAVQLDVVGDGDALPGLRRLTRELGLLSRVTFHGRVDHQQAMRLLSAADLFCYPTSSEGFPKAVLEALACGLPVITTPVSVLPHLLRNGCGRLIETPEPEALGAAILDCLADPAQYQAMSRLALETARQYSLECWRDTIREILAASWGPADFRLS